MTGDPICFGDVTLTGDAWVIGPAGRAALRRQPSMVLAALIRAAGTGLSEESTADVLYPPPAVRPYSAIAVARTIMSELRGKLRTIGCRTAISRSDQDGWALLPDGVLRGRGRPPGRTPGSRAADPVSVPLVVSDHG